MDDFNRVLLMDARRLTEVLPTRRPCVGVTITSPPYWNLKDYQAPNQIGHGQCKADYLADMEKVLAQCFAVTKTTGSLWLIVDTYRQDGEVQLLPLELGELARRAGWWLRDLIVWDKHHSVPWQTSGQLRNVSEFILFMTKSSQYKYHIERIKNLDEISKWWVDFPERFNPKGKTPTNIWSIPIRPRGRWRKPSQLNHFCSFPTALVARIIELTTDPDDLVVDPFAGSGIVLAQAAAMGRRYLGFEVNKEYVQMFREVVRDQVAAEWEEIKQWRESQIDAKLDFEQTVMKLRALKYARQVTRPFLESIELKLRSAVRAIVCIASVPAEYERGHPFDVKILVTVNRRLAELEGDLDKARTRAARPPLTQYGIRPHLQLVTYAQLAEQIEADQVLYLYPKYKPRKYTASGSLTTWFEEGQLEELAEASKVPMLANVPVDVAWVLGE
jgi:DNA modification methylase